MKAQPSPLLLPVRTTGHYCRLGIYDPCEDMQPIFVGRVLCRESAKDMAYAREAMDEYHAHINAYPDHYAAWVMKWR